MRVLITGINGFVGKYLTEYLLSEGFKIWGTTRNSSPNFSRSDNVHYISTDLDNEEELIQILNRIRPDHIYHLAGQSSVKLSWEKKAETLEANVSKTVHLLEAIRKSEVADSVSVLTVGSSEEYGKVDQDEMPIKETTPLRPISPYGISKATVSMLARHYYQAYGLQIIHARPFNHIGPGQGMGFVTSDFAKQIVEIEKGIKSPTITVGNLTAERDFIDVRDITKAYFSVVRFGGAGESYNICSGKPTRISNVLNYYLSITKNNIEILNDVNLMRPIDVPLYYGSNDKLTHDTSWKPLIPLEESLIDILNHCRKTINEIR
jgi:GDP-4-dehydro-6-deoxy-D-mannose reductase